jgi:type IV secretion system protein VirD4
MPKREKQNYQEEMMSGAKHVGGSLMLSLLSVLIGGVIATYLGGMSYQLFNGYSPVSYKIGSCFSIGRQDGSVLTIIIAVIFILIAVTIVRRLKSDVDDDRDMRISKSATYGTSRFMGKEEASKHLEVAPIHKNTGFILGKLGRDVVSLPQDTMFNRHMLVMGAPGTRKSRSFVRPLIMQSVRNGQSCIITDPKGEMYRDTAAYLRENDYDVKVFNLVNPKFSDAWACLDEIKGDVDTAAIFADVIISNIVGPGKSKTEFWTISAKNLLKAMILFVERNEGMRSRGEATLSEVYKLIAISTVAELEAMLGAIDVDHPAHMPFEIFKGAAPQVKDSIKHELGVFLEVFQNETIQHITSHAEIDLEKPAYEKCAYFVIISDQHSTLEFLSSLFFSFLFIKTVDYADNKTNDGKCPVPINVILDEFCNIGIIDGFLKKLATVRGRYINISIIIQGLSQIIDMYDKNYESILSNCDTHIFLGGNDPTTIQYVSDRSGVIGVDQQSVRSRRSTFAPVDLIPQFDLSKGEGKRNLLNADEVYTLDPDKSLIFIRSLHVMKVSKFDFTEHPHNKYLKPENAQSHMPEWRLLFDGKEDNKQQVVNPKPKQPAKTAADNQTTNTTNQKEAKKASSSKPEGKAKAKPNPPNSTPISESTMKDIMAAAANPEKAKQNRRKKDEREVDPDPPPVKETPEQEEMPETPEFDDTTIESDVEEPTYDSVDPETGEIIEDNEQPDTDPEAGTQVSWFLGDELP